MPFVFTTKSYLQKLEQGCTFTFLLENQSLLNRARFSAELYDVSLCNRLIDFFTICFSHHEKRKIHYDYFDY